MEVDKAGLTGRERVAFRDDEAELDAVELGAV